MNIDIRSNRKRSGITSQNGGERSIPNAGLSVYTRPQSGDAPPGREKFTGVQEAVLPLIDRIILLDLSILCPAQLNTYRQGIVVGCLSDSSARRSRPGRRLRS